MIRMIASLLIAYAIVSYMDSYTDKFSTAQTKQSSGYSSLLNATPYERCLANFGQSEQVSQCEVLNLDKPF